MVTIGFGIVSEYSRMRIPRPPQNSTTFMKVAFPLGLRLQFSHRTQLNISHFDRARQTESRNHHCRYVFRLRQELRPIRPALLSMNCRLPGAGGAARIDTEDPDSIGINFL